MAPAIKATIKKRLLYALLLATFGCWYFQDTPARWLGIPAAREPLQTPTNQAAFTHGDYTIQPLANYRITAVVLSRARYWKGNSGKLMPVDLALGWGPMSISGVINELTMKHADRWFQYRFDDEPPLNGNTITIHLANTHCVPANDDVRRQLLAVKRHELVTLQGYLVEITGPKGFRWRSSLSRHDMNAGGCELMWITSVSSRKL